MVWKLNLRKVTNLKEVVGVGEEGGDLVTLESATTEIHLLEQPLGCSSCCLLFHYSKLLQYIQLTKYSIAFSQIIGDKDNIQMDLQLSPMELVRWDYNIKSYHLAQIMSDSDENNGEAIYSDDSDYEQRDSFISGRNSQSYDGSIVEEPYEFDNSAPLKEN